MERMKLVVRIGIGLVLLCVLLGIGATLFVDSLAKGAIERGGTFALGTETRLESASVGLFSGEFALSGLSVANPPGFAKPEFFALRSTALELPLGTLLGDRISIPSLELEGIALDLERNAQGTNYGQILDSLKRFESGASAGGADETATGGGKTFVLQRLVIRDVRASVNLLPAGGELTQLSLAIPEILVTDLASDMTIPELCALVVKTVVQAAIQAGGGTLPADLLADLRGRVQGLEDRARIQVQEELGKIERELGAQAEKLGPEAQKALQKASEELGGKVDELFKKKK
jgi:hypothetical protein